MERWTLATLLTEAAKVCPIFRKMRHFQHAKCWIVPTSVNRRAPNAVRVATFSLPTYPLCVELGNGEGR